MFENKITLENYIWKYVQRIYFYLKKKKENRWRNKSINYTFKSFLRKVFFFCKRSWSCLYALFVLFVCFSIFFLLFFLWKFLKENNKFLFISAKRLESLKTWWWWALNVIKNLYDIISTQSCMRKLYINFFFLLHNIFSSNGCQSSYMLFTRRNSPYHFL